MTRTTIRLKPELVKEAKKIATERNMNFQEVVNISLENFLRELRSYKPKNSQEEIPTFKLGKDLDKKITDKDFIYGPPKV